MKATFRLALVAGICGAALAAGGAEAKEYNVGIVQTLTGPAAFVGVPIKDGALVAVDEINAKQLLGPGNTLKVTVADDAFDRGQAVTLVNRLALDPNVLMIFGPTAGPVALAGGKAANDAKIAAYATTNSIEYTRLGPYSFNLTQPAHVTIPFSARYAIDKMKSKSCVIVHLNDNEAYVTQAKIFKDLVEAEGVKVPAVEGFKTTESDFAALATKIAAMKEIDCIFVTTTPSPGGNFIAQLKMAGLSPSVKIVGSNTFASLEFVKAGGKAVDGVFFTGDWVPGGANDMGREFNAAYKKRTGEDADNWGPIGYSGMKVIAAALVAAGPNPTRESVRDALARTKDVPVPVGTGKYSFDENRQANFGMAVMVVKDGKFVAAP